MSTKGTELPPPNEGEPKPKRPPRLNPPPAPPPVGKQSSTTSSEPKTTPAYQGQRRSSKLLSQAEGMLETAKTRAASVTQDARKLGTTLVAAAKTMVVKEEKPRSEDQVISEEVITPEQAELNARIAKEIYKQIAELFEQIITNFPYYVTNKWPADKDPAEIAALKKLSTNTYDAVTRRWNKTTRIVPEDQEALAQRLLDVSAGQFIETEEGSMPALEYFLDYLKTVITDETAIEIGKIGANEVLEHPAIKGKTTPAFTLPGIKTTASDEEIKAKVAEVLHNDGKVYNLLFEQAEKLVDENLAEYIIAIRGVPPPPSSSSSNKA